MHLPFVFVQVFCCSYELVIYKSPAFFDVVYMEHLYIMHTFSSYQVCCVFSVLPKNLGVRHLAWNAL